MNDQDQPATKRDLREALSEFKTYVVDRENAFFFGKSSCYR
jgi:hypothetical protein